MTSAKKNIKLVVDTYIKAFPEEFALVKEAVVMHRKAMKDDEYGTIENSEMRALFELPERIHTMFVTNLSTEQIMWFKSKEGGRWFAKNFPMFALPNRI